MKKLIIDIDDTLTIHNSSNDYSTKKINSDLLNKIIEYKNDGFVICLFTARNMNTYNQNLGMINKNTAPILLKWLEVNNVPYDEILFGKPWCGVDGFYIDDKAIRPSEFINLSHDEIKELINAGS